MDLPPRNMHVSKTLANPRIEQHRNNLLANAMHVNMPTSFASHKSNENDNMKRLQHGRRSFSCRAILKLVSNGSKNSTEKMVEILRFGFALFHQSMQDMIVTHRPATASPK